MGGLGKGPDRRIELLESRVLLTSGPSLISIIPNDGSLLQPNDTIHTAPTQLTFRFLLGAGEALDQNTLSGIQLTRSGSDGAFGNANDVHITPGFVGIDPAQPNQVVMRFSSPLADDLYRITIIGGSSGEPDPLTDTASPALPFNGGQDYTQDFRLQIGPQVLSVVPQPVTRGASGQLVVHDKEIDVYFSGPVQTMPGNGNALDPQQFQLIDTKNTAISTDDAVYHPASVSYNPANNSAKLLFANSISTIGSGAMRLRIGNTDAPLPAPTTPTPYPGDPTGTFGGSDSIGALGPQTEIFSGTIVPQPIDPNLVFPGGILDPGHRIIPVGGGGENHATGFGGATLITYSFPDIYGSDPTNGQPLHNQITENQKQTVRYIFQLYSYYTGLTFEEVPGGGDQVVVGDTRVLAPDLPPAALGGIAGGGLAIINGNLDWVASLYGSGFMGVAMHEIGHTLGLAHDDDGPPGTIMNGGTESLTTTTGTAPPPLFPGIADITNLQYGYEPNSNQIDLYQFTINSTGTLHAQTKAQQLAAQSSLDSLLTLYEEFNDLNLPASGALINSGDTFKITDNSHPSVTFEFTSNSALINAATGKLPDGNVGVLYSTSSTQQDLAAAVLNAVGKQGLNLSGSVGLNGVEFAGPITVSSAGASINWSQSRKMIARNDDHFGKDSFLSLNLQSGIYYVAVTSTGNDQFNPSIPFSGWGGKTEGNYQLLLDFQPTAAQPLTDPGQSLFVPVNLASIPDGYSFTLTDVNASGQQVTETLKFYNGSTAPGSPPPGQISIQLSANDNQDTASQAIITALQAAITAGGFDAANYTLSYLGGGRIEVGGGVSAKIVVDPSGKGALAGTPLILWGDGQPSALVGNSNAGGAGAYDFWFNAEPTVYVDKTATGTGATGAASAPFNSIQAALNALQTPALLASMDPAVRAAVSNGEQVNVRVEGNANASLGIALNQTGAAKILNGQTFKVTAGSFSGTFEFTNNLTFTSGQVLPDGNYAVLLPASATASAISSSIQGSLKTTGLISADGGGATVTDGGSDANYSYVKIYQGQFPLTVSIQTTPFNARLTGVTVPSLYNNAPYLVGSDQFGNLLPDNSPGNSMLELPKNIVLMVDAGAVFKLYKANIAAGSSVVNIDKSQSALQVLGVPGEQVTFTSYLDDTIGTVQIHPGLTKGPGDWGGLVFNADSDLETLGIFLNNVSEAKLNYGGGQVVVNGVQQAFTPIYLDTARPAIANNLIINSAGAAISANPNAFESTRFGSDLTITVTSIPVDGNSFTVGGTTFEFDSNGVVNQGNVAIPLAGLTSFAKTATAIEAAINNSLFANLVDKAQAIGATVTLPQNLTFGGNTSPLTFTTDSFAVDYQRFGPDIHGNMLSQSLGQSLSAAAGSAIASGTKFVTNNTGFELFKTGTPTPGYTTINITSAMTASQVAQAIANAINAANIGVAAQWGAGLTTVQLAGAFNLQMPAPLTGQQLTAQNTINGLFVRINTSAGQSLDTLDVAAEFASTDIPYVLQENLVIHDDLGYVNFGGGIRQRVAGQLTIDPGVIVKAASSRIEAEMGSNLIAEGTAAQPIVFTSIDDSRYGGGGTFDTPSNGGVVPPQPGDWGGFYFWPTSSGSLDHTLITYAGGSTAIEGGFDAFDTVEIHQAKVRIADSTLQNNAASGGGYRNGREPSDASTIFVLGAQPSIVNNVIQNNAGAAISIDVNSLDSNLVPDWGRSTGLIDRFTQFDDNHGPLVRLNKIGGDSINGMVVRAATLETSSIWDDTDIVHVLEGEVVVPNFASVGGLRLQSSATQSLVVKVANASSGITASGTPLDISDRIGGEVQILGTPQHPVVLTSLKDDSVGGGLTPADTPNNDTNNDGTASTPAPGDWRGLLFDPFSNDRNVAMLNETESALTGGKGTNDTPAAPQSLGQLAPNEQSGDDNSRLGFQVNGYISPDYSQDVDVYTFKATQGTQVWLNVTNTSSALDAVLELVDAQGNVLARSDNSGAEQTNAGNPVAAGGGGDPLFAGPLLKGLSTNNLAQPLQNSTLGTNSMNFWSTNPADPGFRVVLPGSAGVHDYYVRVYSKGAGANAYVPGKGISSGQYQLQIRLRNQVEIPGSTVQYSDIRYATNGIDVEGLPGHSPLVSNSYSQTADHSSRGSAQDLGDLLASDTSSINVGGNLAASTSVDWYKFELTYQEIQVITKSAKTWAAVFDVGYADGLTRPDTEIDVFDSNGNLIYTGRDSNVPDQQPRPGAGQDANELSHSSFGTHDPFIGTVQMPTGQPNSGTFTYYVAIHSNATLPQALDATFNSNATDYLVRLEPVNSINRVVEDHIGSQGGSTAQAPSTLTPLFTPPPASSNPTQAQIAAQLDSYATPFNLADVTMYVTATSPTDNRTHLYSYNPYTGTLETDQGAISNQSTSNFGLNNITMRNDGQLYGMETGLSDGSTNLLQIDPGTAVGSSVGNAGITTYYDDPTSSTQPNFTAANAGIQFDALSYVQANGASNRLLFAVGHRDPSFHDNAAQGLSNNLFYQLDPNTGAATRFVIQQPAAPDWENPLPSDPTQFGTQPTVYVVDATNATQNIYDSTSFNGTPPGANTAAIPAPVQGTALAAASGGALDTNTYYYVVTATTAAGETTASKESAVAVTGPTGAVTVYWAPVPGATGYKIYRGTAAGAENVLAGSVGPLATIFTDTNATAAAGVPPSTNTAVIPSPVQGVPVASANGGALPPGTAYYRVTAVTAIGETDAGLEQSVVIPGLPSNPSGSVTISWSPVPGATGYKIYRGTSAGTENIVAGTVNGGANTSFTDTNNTPTRVVVTSTFGVSKTFEMDSGPEIDFKDGTGTILANASTFRDGEAFTLQDPVTGTSKTFEFDSGPVLVFNAANGVGPGSGATIREHDSFKITDSAGKTDIFEFVQAGDLPSIAGSIVITYIPGQTLDQVISDITSAINGAAGFAAKARQPQLGDNRITITGDQIIDPSLAAGEFSLNTGLQGNYGVTAGRVSVPFEESDSISTLETTIASVVNASFGGHITASFSADNSRMAFLGSNATNFSFDLTSGMIDSFTGQPTGFFYLAGTHNGTSGGDVRVTFRMTDSAFTIATSLSQAINAAGIGVTGRVVQSLAAPPSFGVQLQGSLNASDSTVTPFTFVGASGNGGDITGLASIGLNLYAVSDQGTLYRVNYNAVSPPLNPNGASLTALPQIIDGLTGLPVSIKFHGLTAGPADVENGAYANMLFATSESGQLCAIDVSNPLSPVLRPIFHNPASGDASERQTSIQLPGVSAGSSLYNNIGLAFSTLDYNLWHVTQARDGDAGHGITVAPDNSRNASSANAPPKNPVPNPGNSFYFGIEDPRLKTTISQQPGAGNYTTAGTSPYQTYNLPGGAYGSLATNTFSLAGYNGGDKPTLYFNYYLDAGGNQQVSNANPRAFDSARVFVSSDGGVTWDLAATNNTRIAAPANPSIDPTAELASYVSASEDTGSGDPRQQVQPLWDSKTSNSGWRQARIDLTRYAGDNNIELRFDFSTAGTTYNPSSPGNYAQGAADAGLDSLGHDNTFGVYQGASNTGAQGRGQDNNHEGWYVDDIVVGFAGRGEMVTDVKQLGGTSNTAYFNVPVDQSPTAPKQLLTGPYQLEIRRGAEYGSNNNNFSPDISLNQSFNVNDRLDSSFTLNTDFTQAPIAALTSNTATWSFTGLEPTTDGQGILSISMVVQSTAEVGTDTTQPSSILVQIPAIGFSRTITFNTPSVGQPRGQTVTARYTLSAAQMAALTTLGAFNLAATAQQNIDTDLIGIISASAVLDYMPFGEHQQFTIEDGKNRQTFEFVKSGSAYAAGNVPIVYSPGSTTPQDIAYDILAAIGGADPSGNVFPGIYDPTKFNVSAGIEGTGNNKVAGLIALFGATNVYNGDSSGNNKLAASYFGPSFPAGRGKAPNVFVINYDFGLTYQATTNFGDTTMPRPQGEVILYGNQISNSSQNGILVKAPAPGTSFDSPPDSNASLPHPGGLVNTPTLNGSHLAPGVVIVNNLIYGVGQNGISFQGNSQPAGAPQSVVPFGRIVNNTIYGGDNPTGTGILVTNNSYPTILNNVLVNLASGRAINVTGGASAVLGENFYQNSGAAPVNVGLGSFDRVVTAATPSPFRNASTDPATANFYLTDTAIPIDSSINSLQDRTAMTSVTSPLGIPPSPIIAPGFDLYGELRIDDPAVTNANLGAGQNVFIDRGAIEHTDTTGPTAALLAPIDNDQSDLNTAPNIVFVRGHSLSEFTIQLNDGSGAGIFDASANDPSRVDVRQDGRLLTPGVDYTYAYDNNNHVIRLIALSGVWLNGHQYDIYLDNGVQFDPGNPAAAPVGIADRAGNFLQANGPDGLTHFRLLLGNLTNSPPVVQLVSSGTGTPSLSMYENDNAASPTSATFSLTTPFSSADNTAVAMTIFDVDANGGSETLTLSAAHGTLKLSSQALIELGSIGVTPTGDGTNSITITAPIGEASAVAPTPGLNAALEGLVFTPDLNFDSHLGDQAAVTVTIDDNGNSPAPAQTAVYSIPINVIAVNDAPVTSVPTSSPASPIGINEDTPLTFSSAGGNAVTVADSDITAADANNALLPPFEEIITVNPSNLGTLTIANVAGITFTGGTSNGQSKLDFLGTLAAINQALDGLIFNPAEERTGAVQVTFLTNDHGNIGVGLAPQYLPAPQPLSSTQTVYINILSVVDAPTLNTSANLTFQPVIEDTPPASNLGSTVLAMLQSDPLVQPNAITLQAPGAQYGIAITGMTETSNGLWQYKARLSATWTPFPAVSNTRALLIDANDSVRFLPNPKFDDTRGPAPTISFVAWDHTYDLFNGGPDVDGAVVDLTQTGTGGSTPFSLLSAGNATATLHVTPAAEAPTLASTAALAFNSINEDQQLISNNGSTILTMLQSDPNNQPNAITLHAAGTPRYGIAVTGLTQTANGVWQYQIGGGWANIPLSVSATSALLLDGNDSIRFLQNPKFDNTRGGAPTLTFVAWDETFDYVKGIYDLDGSTVNLSTTGQGGSTPFSSTSAIASLSVNPLPEAPTLNSGAALSLASIKEDVAPANNLGGTVLAMLQSDPNSLPNAITLNAVVSPQFGIAVVGLGQTSNGTWQYQLPGGAWTAFPSVSTSGALLLDGGDLLRFLPNANFNDFYGGPATLSFVAWDETFDYVNGGVDTHGQTVNLTLTGTGGSTPFSAGAPAVAKLSVKAVNDPPTVGGPSGPIALSPSSAFSLSTAALPAFTVADVDLPEGNQQMQVTINTSENGVAGGAVGLTQLTGITIVSGANNTANVTFKGSITNVLAALANLVYEQDINFNGTASLTLIANDLGNSGLGPQGQPAPFPLSSAPFTATLTGVPIHRAPVLSSGSPSFPAILENVPPANTPPAGTMISAMLATAGANFLTVDTAAGGLQGIAVTSVAPSTGGVWQYSANGTSWTTIAGVALNQALLLPASDQLRFWPNPGFAGVASITFYAWDQVVGTAGSTADLSGPGATGGFSSFSTSCATATLNVKLVNQPPLFTLATNQSVLENNTVTANGGSPGGSNAAPISLTNFVTGISPGQPIEIQSPFSQTVTFTVTTDRPDLFSVQPTLDPAAPGATTSTLHFSLNPDVFGAATISVIAHDNGGTANGGNDTSLVATTTLTVALINDPPSLNPIPNQSILENAAQQTLNLSGIASGLGESQNLTVTATSDNPAVVPNPTIVYTSPNTGATLKYTPVAYASGIAHITVTVHDDGGTANGGIDTFTQTFTVNVQFVNQPPSFVKGPDEAVNEDSPLQVISGWATQISPGPGNAEPGQALNFIVTPDNPNIFAVPPSIDPATGTLRYQFSQNFSGSTNVNVKLHDNGGTANGGVDTSATQSFKLTSNFVNDIPTFAAGGDQTVNENAPAQTVVGWATAISPGPGFNEAGQTLNFQVTTTNPSLFAAGPAIDPATGTLTYTPALNAYGTAIVTVTLHDNGGTANGGIDTSLAQAFNINVNFVNHAPSFVGGPNQIVNENAPAQTVTGWAKQISPGPASESAEKLNFIVTTDNNSLFSTPPSIDPVTGTLTYTPQPFAAGVANVTVKLHDDAGTANGGVDTSPPQTFKITVNFVNQAPSFTIGPDQTVNEDAPPQTVANFATQISPGPGAKEVGQALNFIITNDNNGLFVSQPTIDPLTGTLRYSLTPHASGAANVTVQLHDNGGTANGGVDTSAAQVFKIVANFVNHAPSFVLVGGDQFVTESTGAHVVPNFVSQLSAGIDAIEATQKLNFLVSIPNNDNALFSAPPSINATTGALTYTLAPGQFGTATVTVALHDDGGTDNGGVDTSPTQTFKIFVNAPPTAQPDFLEISYAKTSSSTAAIGVLSNDSDPNGDPLTAVLVSPPAYGSFLLHADGSFNYTPGPNFRGLDQFTYMANDGHANSNVVTVRIMSHDASNVRKLYEQVLNRDPDDAGMQYWTNLIQNGSSLAVVAQGIFESDERLNPIISNYYSQFLLRTPDASGLAYWRDQVWKVYGGPEHVISGMISSPEFFQSAGGTNAAWVQALYQRLLNRKADAQGLQYWDNLLDTHQMNELDVVNGFLSSDEYYTNLIDGFFQEYLGRQPNLDELASDLAQMHGGVSDRAIQLEIVVTDEYKNTPPPPPLGGMKQLSH